jgi:hypothetical protein
MATSSGWSKNFPSGSSSIALGDDEIRSTKSYLEAWLEEEHYVLGGSATSAGRHRLGSGRIFVGPSSQLSNPSGDNHGRMFWTTDTETLFVAASSSSWSAIADAIHLDSQQTFTSKQEFSDVVVTGAIGGIVSVTSVLAADQGVGAAEQSVSVITTTQELFTVGDFLVGSYDSVTNGGVLQVYPRLVSSDHSQIGFYYYNAGASRVTLPAGTTIRVLGFKKDV